MRKWMSAEPTVVIIWQSIYVNQVWAKGGPHTKPDQLTEACTEVLQTQRPKTTT